MTEAEIRKLAHEAADLAARKAVRETLTALGIDTDKPFEFQEKMNFVRSLQNAATTIGRQTLTAFIGTVVLGALWAIWAKIGGPVK
jgi:hypothetical protein